MDVSTAMFMERARVQIQWDQSVTSKKFGDKTKVGNQLHVLIWVQTQAH